MSSSSNNGLEERENSEFTLMVREGFLDQVNHELSLERDMKKESAW